MSIINDLKKRVHANGSTTLSMEDFQKLEKECTKRAESADYVLVPLNLPVNVIADMLFCSDVELAIGHAAILENITDAWSNMIRCAAVKDVQ